MSLSVIQENWQTQLWGTWQQRDIGQAKAEMDGVGFGLGCAEHGSGRRSLTRALSGVGRACSRFWAQILLMDWFQISTLSNWESAGLDFRYPPPPPQEADCSLKCSAVFQALQLPASTPSYRSGCGQTAFFSILSLDSAILLFSF